LAELYDISDNEKKSILKRRLSRIVQSANLNFLIGSGCSYPAIKALGETEKNIVKTRKYGKNTDAEKLLRDFLIPFVKNTESLVNNKLSKEEKTTALNYQSFLANISNLLFDRRNNIIPCQATIFSTNYDLFIEYAMNQFNENVILLDGFKRTPNINNEYFFTSTEYFNTVSNIGNYYRYKVDIPSINLIKIHGSLNWKKENNKIIQNLSYLEQAKELKDSSSHDDIKTFNSLFSIILPQENKYELTISEQIYYDLLRIFSNELDKENTSLFVEGFSFADEHILEIAYRALKNKTFNMVVFCYNKTDMGNLSKLFNAYRNVDIVYKNTGDIDFACFNSFFNEITAHKEEDHEEQNN
jgi:hypothetical protein